MSTSAPRPAIRSTKACCALRTRRCTALGWVLTESIAVDPDTGEVHDLTIRSFGIIRARDMPPVSIMVLEDPGAPRARASDAVFAAVAAAAWNAVTRAEGTRPDTFPARDTRASRLLRR